MKKLVLGLILAFFGISVCYTQVDTLSIEIKYLNAKTNNLLKYYDKLNSISFLRTDTVIGYEIRYFYLYGGKENSCSDKLYFTLNEINKYKDLYSIFKNEIVSYQYSSNYVPPSFFINKGDTFYSTKERQKYDNINFSKKHNKNKIVYKISNYEYCEFYKVKVIVDIFTGDSTALYFFNPLITSCSEKQIVFYEYKAVLGRKIINDKVILGARRQKNSKIVECKYCDY